MLNFALIRLSNKLSPPQKNDWPSQMLAHFSPITQKFKLRRTHLNGHQHHPMDPVAEPYMGTASSGPMSSLSVQMQAIEKDSHEGAPMSNAVATPSALDGSRTQDEVHEPSLYGKTYLLPPPPSMLSRFDCEFAHNHHPDDNVTGNIDNNNIVQKNITIPGEKMARSFAATEREYDMATWKMYLRIQTSRRSFACDRESEIGNDISVHASHDVSRQDELDTTEPIFELELDF